MKTVKYFLVGALMTAISAPVMAQSDDVVSQATEIIKGKAEDADKQVKNLVKPFKKDAKTLGTTKVLIDKLTEEGSVSKLQLMQELFGMSREELLAELTKQSGGE